ncbi:MAG: hypothetical protein GXP22_10070 [Gammaproteobacteria bacterium]|nr:hypothetical protein [Gammaproteobacteria bacterium]
MCPVVRIPEQTYKRLEQHAEGFDSPARVVERLLNHFEGVEDVLSDKLSSRAAKRRPREKYSFNKQVLGKGRMVLAVVKAYQVDHPDASFADLINVFPEGLQGSMGVFSEQAKAQEIFERTGHKRHFIKDAELIKLSDGVIAVSTEWGAGNIEAFIQNAASLGYVVSLLND